MIKKARSKYYTMGYDRIVEKCVAKYTAKSLCLDCLYFHLCVKIKVRYWKRRIL